MNKKYLSIYLIGLFLLNLLQSAFVELSYDEAYYWIYSQFPSWGYYDHPPMVAWLISLGSWLGHSELAVRFFFNVLGCGSIYFLWKITNQKNIKTFISLVSSLALVQASGFLALPDTGLLFFATLFLYFVKDYIKAENTKNVIGLILSITMLFYSKYHGLAVVLFTTFTYPAFFKRRSFWLVVLSVVVLYLPHVYWQYTHDFVTFKFHLFGRGEKVFDVYNIINYLSSQIVLLGIFNLFILIILIKKVNFKSSWERILFMNVFGFLILLFFVSFRNQIEANWTVTATMASVPLFLILLERRPALNKWVKITSLLPVAIIIIFRIILFLPDSYYEGKKISRLNEVKGWEQRVDKLSKVVSDKIVIADNYQIAAKLSFYMNKIIPALHLTSRDSHYNLLKEQIKDIDLDEEVFFLSPKIKVDSVKVETGYKDPIYIHKTTLRKLLERYGLEREYLLKPDFSVLKNQ